MVSQMGQGKLEYHSGAIPSALYLAFTLLPRHIRLVLRYFYLSLGFKDVMKHV